MFLFCLAKETMPFYVPYIDNKLPVPLITPSVTVSVWLNLSRGKTVSLHICPNNILKCLVTWSKLLSCLCWKATPETGLIISVPFFSQLTSPFSSHHTMAEHLNIPHEIPAFRGHYQNCKFSRERISHSEFRSVASASSHHPDHDTQRITFCNHAQNSIKFCT